MPIPIGAIDAHKFLTSDAANILFGLNNVSYDRVIGNYRPAGQAGTDFDLYVVPSGKRALIVTTVFNPSKTVVTWFAEDKISGVYYRISVNSAPAANAASVVNFGIVYEPGETIAINVKGTTLTLTQVAASGGVATYTGTITGGGSNAFAGEPFVIEGFSNSGNNGTFTCTGSSTTTLTFAATTQVNETHAGQATDNGGLNVTSMVILFDTSSPLKTAKIFSLSLASGDNAVYTCPTGKTARIAGFSTLLNTSGQGSGQFVNQTGSTVTLKSYIVPNGGSAQQMSQASITTNSTGGIGIDYVLSAGDVLKINIDQTGKAMASLTIFEEAA